ncbi:class I SAM-dependent methyltransferase [Maribacter sp. CXY002]|uniref:class I SAM-dependent methyltransferase n=1 Tax=Maribacter luteocoastalis TaxID=3407671 RepID=UPI003B678A9B
MKTYLKTKDYFFTNDEFELLYDQELDMLVTHPQPKDISEYYDSTNYISHSDNTKNLIDKIYHIIKNYSLNKKTRLINNYASKNKTLLDIGAGTADFLIKAKKSKWLVTGVEPNPIAREKAKQKGMELQPNLNLLSKQQFNIITLWHVLEHLPNLEKDIQKIIESLEDNGTLIIAVPNYKSYDAKKYNKYWAAYDVPRHLWHFSKTSIHKLFKKHNLEIIKIKPMIFDSFYVALLSEKYQHHSFAYLKAFYYGLLSNLKALHTKEHSSLIYIIKKKKNSYS